MQKYLVSKGNVFRPPLNDIGLGLIFVFLGTALLSLQNPAREYLFPFAPYLQLALQLGTFFLLAPLLRIRAGSAGFLFMLGLYLLMLMALLSTFWSPFPELVLQRSLLIFAPLLAIVAMTLSDDCPHVTFLLLAKALTLFGAIISILGVFIYLFGQVETTTFGTVQSVVFGSLRISQRVYGPAPFLRISSLFGNPNTLAAWLLITLTTTFFLILNFPRRTLWWLSAASQGVALILTFSRAGIVANLISLGLLLYFAGRRFRKWCFLFLSILIVIAAGILFTNFYAPMRIAKFSLDLNLRELAWMPLWVSICNHPFSGVGFGVSYEGILELLGIPITAHNIFLAILSEVGLIGFFVFIFLWILPICSGLRKLRSSSQPTRFVLATSLSICCALLFHQAFEGSVLRYGFHTLIWAYLLTLMLHPRLGMAHDDKEAPVTHHATCDRRRHAIA